MIKRYQAFIPAYSFSEDVCMGAASVFLRALGYEGGGVSRGR